MNLSYFKYTIVSNSIAKEHDNWYSCGDSPITNSDPDGMQFDRLRDVARECFDDIVGTYPGDEIGNKGRYDCWKLWWLSHYFILELQLGTPELRSLLPGPKVHNYIEHNITLSTFVYDTIWRIMSTPSFSAVLTTDLFTVCTFMSECHIHCCETVSPLEHMF
jgi:hypothetical protein